MNTHLVALHSSEIDLEPDQITTARNGDVYSIGLCIGLRINFILQYAANTILKQMG